MVAPSHLGGVGRNVGDRVGASVGESVGATVGASVGVTVGKSVGASVGATNGGGVRSTHPARHKGGGKGEGDAVCVGARRQQMRNETKRTTRGHGVPEDATTGASAPVIVRVNEPALSSYPVTMT